MQVGLQNSSRTGKNELSRRKLDWGDLLLRSRSWGNRSSRPVDLNRIVNKGHVGRRFLEKMAVNYWRIETMTTDPRGLGKDGLVQQELKQVRPETYLVQVYYQYQSRCWGTGELQNLRYGKEGSRLTMDRNQKAKMNTITRGPTPNMAPGTSEMGKNASQKLKGRGPQKNRTEKKKELRKKDSWLGR